MKAREVSNRIQDWQKKASETVKNAGQATDEYVHENIWTSIAYAAAIGCVLGLLLGRRRD